MFDRFILISACLLALAMPAHAEPAAPAPGQDSLNNPDNPPALAAYRLKYRDMVQIANDKKLAHRIFYTPSSGPDAKWFDAVKQGNLEQVAEMLQQGQNIDAKDDAALGQTALGWAAFIGYEDMVRYLVGHGANLQAADRDGAQNVLAAAALGNNAAVFKYLHEQLRDRVDLSGNGNDSSGQTLLMLAAANDRVSIVEYLLHQHVDLNRVNRNADQDALSTACSHGYQDLAALLIEAGAINHRTGKASCLD